MSTYQQLAHVQEAILAGNVQRGVAVLGVHTAGAYTPPLLSSTYALFVGFAGRCKSLLSDKNGSG
jgi:hypothetical protein